ncbi:MAG: hypothetical protein AB7K09_24735 [Planctomycetota bacterium]
MIDPQETHYLDVANRATIWLRRTDAADAILRDAATMAGFAPTALDEMGPAVLLVRLARAWPWPGGPAPAEASDGESSFIEYIEARCKQATGRGVVLMNRPLPRREPDPPRPEDLELKEQARAIGDFTTIWDTGTGCAISVEQREPAWYYAPDDDTPLPTTLKVLLDYPLSVPVVFEWQADSDHYWDVWELIGAICTHYQRIYAEADRYGVWGHDIGDLVIESIEFSRSLGLIVPSIGS